MDLDIIIGVLLVITFCGFIAYAIKGYNLMVGMLIMTALWTGLPLIGNAFSPNVAMEGQSLVDVLTTVYQKAPETWGTILVNVLWGAWFGRVLLETGIASNLIKKTVELGGNKPFVTMTLLNIVTAIIFTSMTGAGPVIAIAVIVIPILLSLGIPKVIALFSFMGSIMAGIFLNIVNFNQYHAFFSANADQADYTYNTYFSFGLTALIIALILVTAVSGFLLKKSKPTYNWAASNGAMAEPEVPAIALITPILPVVGVIAFQLPVIFGFTVSGLFALAICGRFKGGFKEACRIINKLYADGVIDTAPLIGFLLCMAAFNSSAAFAAPYFNAVVGGIIPSSALGLFIMFAIFAPLGYFRGPMNLVGSGAATLAVISAVTNFPMTYLYPLFAISTVGMQHLDITQSWVAWGMGYAKVEGKDYMKVSYPTGWVIAVILCIIAFVRFGSF